MPDALSFHDVVRSRHSVRDFLPDAVPEPTIRSVLEEAQHAPSNCNTQPWHVHVVSGATRDRLSAALLEADQAGKTTPDFSFAISDFYGVYSARSAAQGKTYHEAIGVAREDFDERHTASRRNLEFFGAPHVALLFMPVFGDSVRCAGDIGMYGQTLLLSLAAHGLGGIPQTMLGFYADTIRKVLSVDATFKLLFGISFGYPNADSAANRYRIGKAPLEESLVFHV